MSILEQELQQKQEADKKRREREQSDAEWRESLGLPMDIVPLEWLRGNYG